MSNNAAAPRDRSELKPEDWVDRYGDALYRFALMSVRDPSVAEELVQETFMGALRSAGNYRGRSSEKTWLVAILKHKIIDHFRTKHRREHSTNKIEAFSAIDDNPFDQKGDWRQRPAAWQSDPFNNLQQKQFLEVLYCCLSKIPERLSRAFVLREIDGLSTEELCKTLEISKTNSWVMLYRARMALRDCIEASWFDRAKEIA
jgi:RNA polymerase sigma-70 factor (ECF subfamily)